MPTIAKICLLLAALFAASCSTIEKKTENTLAGRWRWTDGPHIAEYVFLENGTFTGFVRSDGTLVSKFKGKWRTQENAILYEYTGDEIGSIPVGTKDRDKLLSVSADHYMIEAADGSVRKYVRVSEG